MLNMKDIETRGREIVICHLYGSHNYNLNTEHSDEDYKVYVMPTFEDLYWKDQYKHHSINDDLDYEVHDVRKITELLWKSNINFMEILYSKDVYVNPKYQWFFDWLMENKEEITAINLPYLYDSIRGNIIQKIKKYNKVEDLKDLHHSVRLDYFLKDFKDGGFENFIKYVRYDPTSDKAKMLIDIKLGNITKEKETELSEMINFRIKKDGFYHTEYHDSYHEYSLNEELKEEINNQIMKLVKQGLGL